MRRLLLGIAILVVSAKGFADQGADANGGNTQFDDFYTVSEQSKTQKSDSQFSIDPLTTVQEFFAQAE
ncbi:MAG: hypothetical protein J7501_11605, partial [Bdellovibrio sp.]|nr:hypothetical protein [Bdellovibrio sp.]